MFKTIIHIFMSPSTERERHVGLLLTAHFSVRWPCVHLSCRRSNTRRWPNVGLLLAHRLWRWANISPVLGYCVVFDATLNVGQRHRRPANITLGPMSQHSLKVYSLKERLYRGVLCWARRSAWPSDYQGVIIKIHISNNISVTGQRREQWPSIQPTLVWYL